MFRWNLKALRFTNPKSLARKRKTFFFPSDSALPHSTEYTLFQHNLIYFVFPLASILPNALSPLFSGEGASSSGRGKVKMYKGSEFNCKIQLLKIMKTRFPLSCNQKQGRCHTNRLRKCFLGMDTLILRITYLLFLHFAQDGLKLSP